MHVDRHPQLSSAVPDTRLNATNTTPRVPYTWGEVPLGGHMTARPNYVQGPGRADRPVGLAAKSGRR